MILKFRDVQWSGQQRFPRQWFLRHGFCQPNIEWPPGYLQQCRGLFRRTDHGHDEVASVVPAFEGPVNREVELAVGIHEEVANF